jgi:hypothetical protein
MELNQKVKDYLTLRDKKKKIEALMKEKIKIVTDQMSALELEMLDFLDAAGVQSAKTNFGTPYKTKKTGYSVNDSDAFFNYVIKNKAIDLLHKRVNSSAAKLYFDDDIEIPGVSTYNEIKLLVKTT